MLLNAKPGNDLVDKSTQTNDFVDKSTQTIDEKDKNDAYVAAE